jgi:hypothetical protein
MEVCEVKRLKSLKEENSRLKKLLTEAMLDKVLRVKSPPTLSALRMVVRALMSRPARTDRLSLSENMPPILLILSAKIWFFAAQ